jgi:hypothetical protein
MTLYTNVGVGTLNSAYDVSSFLRGGSGAGGYNTGMLNWYSKMFRFWKGSFQVKVLGPKASVLQYYPSTTTALALLRSVRGHSPSVSHYGQTTPFEVTDEATGIQEIKLPFYTPYAYLKIPHADLEEGLPEYSTGSIGYMSRATAMTTNELTDIYVSGGDDLKFFGLLRVPSMTLDKLGVPEEDEVKLEIQMDHYETKDPGVKTGGAVGIEFAAAVTSNPTGGVFEDVSQHKATNLDEAGITFRGLAERFQLIRAFSWSDFPTPGTVIQSFDLPLEGLVASSNQRAFDAFLFYHGTMKVKLQVNSNMFQQGKLCMSFWPLATVAEATVLASNRVNLSISNHVDVMAGSTREVELMIPYRHYQDALRISNGDTLGTLTLTVFNQLENGPTVPAPNHLVRLNMFIAFPDSDFQVLNPAPSVLARLKEEVRMRVEIGRICEQCDERASLHHYFVELPQGAVEPKIFWYCSKECKNFHVPTILQGCLQCSGPVPEPNLLEEIVTLSVGEFSTTTPRGWCSRNCARNWDSEDDEVELEIQGGVQSGLKNVQNTMDYAGKAAGAASSIIGELDKPNYAQNTMQVVKKKYPKLANIDTVEQATVLDAFTVRQDVVSTSERAVDVDEMSMQHLLGTPSFLGTVRMNDNDIPGELLFASPMTINPQVMQANATATINPTLMGYVTSHFGYWQCDLEITLEFVASKVHTTRLFVGLVYGGVASGVPFEQITGQYGLSIDFNAANTTVKLKIPYRTNLQQLRVARPDDQDPLTCSLGEWGIWVINPLVANESVASTADINVYVNAVPCAGRSDYGLQFMGANSGDFTV